MAALPGFRFVQNTNYHGRLHEILWRTPSSTPAVSAAPEPAALAELIDGQPPIRFINLDQHLELRVHKLRKPQAPMIIIRDEYIEFMTYVLQLQNADDRRFFLTGQPGIGKSVGACYFLFWLLASGHSVFFIPAPGRVYYFSEAGVQRLVDEDLADDDPDVQAAVECSWVLIDVDIGNSVSATDWYPQDWLKGCTTMVWTSSPQHERLRRFTNHFCVRVWYMSPWSEEEIDAVVKLQSHDPAEIQARRHLSGPVPRSLFCDQTRAKTSEIDHVIKKSLTKGLFQLSASEWLYLLRPQEKLDAHGVPYLDREESTLNWLSDYVVTCTVELMDRNLDNIRDQLVSAFDDPRTRGAAGKLVENMLHRALRRRVVAPFGVGGCGLNVLGLIGKADNFTLEGHMPTPRFPLYLRLQSQNFAAVDAIVVSGVAIWFVQSSVGDSHSTIFKTLLAILVQLKQLRFKVNGVRLVYCLVGVSQSVGRLARAATRKLAALKAANPTDREQELGQTGRVVNWLWELDVEGYMFSTMTELTQVEINDEDESGSELETPEPSHPKGKRKSKAKQPSGSKRQRNSNAVVDR
ncbi:hypothetical protein GGX14DRAFT_459855 [Mycena pura]|uniref:Uncharacterized protein n=1 Tax=Mycena pura TaxID=153505 RepID=A0AAD6V7J4_9AGAR|nr:hypothetical protein GGX14DRAFT_459855 [Mycena pura]